MNTNIENAEIKGNKDYKGVPRTKRARGKITRGLSIPRLTPNVLNKLHSALWNENTRYYFSPIKNEWIDNASVQCVFNGVRYHGKRGLCVEVDSKELRKVMVQQYIKEAYYNGTMLVSNKGTIYLFETGKEIWMVVCEISNEVKMCGMPCESIKEIYRLSKRSANMQVLEI